MKSAGRGAAYRSNTGQAHRALKDISATMHGVLHPLLKFEAQWLTEVSVPGGDRLGERHQIFDHCLDQRLAHLAARN